MKKKILSTLLSAVAIVSAVCMTGCTDDAGIDGIKSDRVDSAEAWTAAFVYKDVTNARVVATGLEDFVSREVLEVDGDKAKYTRVRTKNGKTEEIVSYFQYNADEICDAEEFPDNRGTEYRYEFNEETQKWEVISKNPGRIHTIVRGAVYDICDFFVRYDEESHRVKHVYDCFSFFTYDESTYRYVSEISYIEKLDIYNSKMCIKIKDGIAVYGRHMADSSNGDHYDVTFTVTDIGNVKVELPNVE